MVTGYRAALEDGAAIVVKLDGDGQADPGLIPSLVGPILAGQCDYIKGNRFFNPENLSNMPKVRLLGNAILSFLSKASTGYWSIMDPTNGLTAISVPVLRLLPLEKLPKGYFFETDILFRLNAVRAVVEDFPMRVSIAGGEQLGDSEGHSGIHHGSHTEHRSASSLWIFYTWLFHCLPRAFSFDSAYCFRNGFRIVSLGRQHPRRDCDAAGNGDGRGAAYRHRHAIAAVVHRSRYEVRTSAALDETDRKGRFVNRVGGTTALSAAPPPSTGMKAAMLARGLIGAGAAMVHDRPGTRASEDSSTGSAGTRTMSTCSRSTMPSRW